MKVQITFRSGVQLVVDVDKVIVTYDGPAGRISRIQWADSAAGNRLLAIVPADVVAVVELDVPPPELPHVFDRGPGVAAVEHQPHRGMSCEQVSQPRRRRVVTRELARDVAGIYRSSHTDGRPPTVAVAEHFKVSHRTAARWVAQAREFGELGPAPGTKPGEAE